VTPEATRLVCDRLVEGLSERMRAVGLTETPMAPLSRGVCGCLGSTLIVNVPGSPAGAVTSLKAILELLPHALRLLTGDTNHGEAAS
jgi:molybdopterin biosynthesis enzyme MoaB